MPRPSRARAVCGRSLSPSTVRVSRKRIPVALQDSLLAAEGRAGADRGAAMTNLLNPGKRYVRDNGAWDSDARTPTGSKRSPRSPCGFHATAAVGSSPTPMTNRRTTPGGRGA